MTAPYKPVKANTEEWETPDHIFEPLNREFGFSIDVAASNENAKGSSCAWFTKEEDGLAHPWFGTCWCNPPYSAKTINAFINKAIAEADGPRAVTTVLLVPSKTDQPWWHKLVERGAEFRYVLGRVKFVGAKHGAPFPVCVVVVRPKPKQITGKQGPPAQGGEG